jgi:hypothetical protein
MNDGMDRSKVSLQTGHLYPAKTSVPKIFRRFQCETVENNTGSTKLIFTKNLIFGNRITNADETD